MNQNKIYYIKETLNCCRAMRAICWDAILLDFSLTVKTATLIIFISGCGSAISSTTLSPSYTVTIQAPIHHDSSRFETDGKIGMRRDGKKEIPVSIR